MFTEVFYRFGGTFGGICERERDTEAVIFGDAHFSERQKLKFFNGTCIFGEGEDFLYAVLAIGHTGDDDMADIYSLPLFFAE